MGPTRAVRFGQYVPVHGHCRSARPSCAITINNIVDDLIFNCSYPVVLIVEGLLNPSAGTMSGGLVTFKRVSPPIPESTRVSVLPMSARARHHPNSNPLWRTQTIANAVANTTTFLPAFTSEQCRKPATDVDTKPLAWFRRRDADGIRRIAP